MKRLKTMIPIFFTMLVILATIFAAGRYGWKLLGFRACQGTAIDSVEVGENAVKIQGCYPGSFPEGFCGYYAEECDGTLYVGFHFSAVFGLFETGNFDVTIPVKGEIHEVVLKTKLMETSIWTAENGDAAARKLLTDEARELLDSAGCKKVEITWGSTAPEPVEAIMQAAGLR